MKSIQKTLSLLSVLVLLVSMSFMMGCDEDEPLERSCSGQSVEDLAWGQTVIADLNSKTYKSRIEAYNYQGDYVLFVIPNRNDPNSTIPCDLYDCDGNILCTYNPVSDSGCSDFFSNRTFVKIAWEN